MESEKLRSLQTSLKKRYRQPSKTALVTLKATLVVLPFLSVFFCFSRVIALNGETETPATNEFVTVKDGHFFFQGKRLIFNGVNYRPRYAVAFSDKANPNYQDGFSFWIGGEFHESEIEQDLEQMKKLGINLLVVRGIAPGDRRSLPLTNLRRLIELVHQHGLFVLLYQGFPLTTPATTAPNLYKEEISFLGLQNETALIGYDIAWEARIGDQSKRKHFDKDWTEWVIKKYGSIKSAESHWNFRPEKSSASILSSPSDEQLKKEGVWSAFMTDYWTFAYDWGNSYFGAIVHAIKEADPNHLVTIRNGYGGTGSISHNPSIPFDIAMGAEFLDFLSPEAYGAGNIHSPYDWQVPDVYCQDSPQGRYNEKELIADRSTDNHFDFAVVPAKLKTAAPPIPQELDLVPGPRAIPSTGNPKPHMASGHVIRLDNGKPMEGVKVDSCGGPGAVTDKNGFFEFPLKGRKRYCVHLDLDKTWEIIQLNPNSSLIEEAAWDLKTRVGFVTSYARWASHNKKPIVWLEFGRHVGIIPLPETLELEKDYYRDIYQAGLLYDVDGMAAWEYSCGPRIDERMDSGIINPDGSERPVCEYIKQYGQKMGKSESRSIDLVFDVKPGFQNSLGFGGVYEANKLQFEELLKKGKTPGVRFSGQ